jgi:hypothetical protein
MWKRSGWNPTLQTIYDTVIPKDDQADEEKLLQDDTYRCYAVGEQALALVKYLPKTKSVYIDTFTIAEAFRGQSLGLKYWENLHTLLGNTWEVSNFCIEAYLHNVPYFERFFKWKQSSIQDHKFVKTPTVWMFEKLESEQEIINEWQEWATDSCKNFIAY